MSLVPIDEVVFFTVVIHDTSVTPVVVADASSTPTFQVFEEDTDAPMIAATNLTKRTSLTGRYRGTFTASSANGFEAGKWYNVDVSATCGGVADVATAMRFRAAPAEVSAGVPEVNVRSITAGIVAAASFAAGALDAVWSTAARTLTAFSFTPSATLSAGERNSVADAILDRDMSTGTDSGSTTVRTVRQALRFLRNKWSISGGTLTVTKENDTTASWTAAVTTTAGDPVSTVDPA